MSLSIQSGTFGGKRYEVRQENGVVNIYYLDGWQKIYKKAGYNMELLKNIGDRKPEEVLREFDKSGPPLPQA